MCYWNNYNICPRTYNSLYFVIVESSTKTDSGHQEVVSSSTEKDDDELMPMTDRQYCEAVELVRLFRKPPFSAHDYTCAILDEKKTRAVQGQQGYNQSRSGINAV